MSITDIAINLNAHLLKDFLIEVSQCSYCWSETERNVHFYVQDTLNKEMTFLSNLMTLVCLFILTSLCMVHVVLSFDTI